MVNKLRHITVGIMLSIIVVGMMPANAVTVSNLMLSGTPEYTIGNLTLFTVNESNQGVDLNSDGDTFDEILHYYNSTDATVTNLGIQDILVGFNGNDVLLLVSESNGGIDLNGDGDTTDSVYHAYDISTGITTNLQLATAWLGADNVRENKALFRVSESNQGSDLNGDGDTSDVIVFVHDFSSGVTTNLQINSSNLYSISGDIFNLFVSESEYGSDLNGDGDTNDTVLHVHDFSSGTTTNLQLASSSASTDGNLVVFSVYESFQGSDLNSDGDTLDRLLHIYDTNTGTVDNTEIPIMDVRIVSANYIAFRTEENQLGSDLNGDGDMFDQIPFIYEISSGTLTDFGIAISDYRVFQEILLFYGNESSHGSDLNGDGDTNDQQVLFVYDFSTGTLTNLQLQTNLPWIKDGKVAFTVPEVNQGVDLNNDFDTNDNVVHLYDITTDTITNLEFASVYNPGFYGTNLIFPVSESQEQTDLNGDGDTSDNVMHSYDITKGTIHNSGFATTNWTGDFDGNTIAFMVGEAAQGGFDLNGDGDSTDYVIHIYDLSPITQSSVLSGQVEVAQTCGLNVVAGNPLDYGSILPGDESAEQTITLDNTGNTDLTTLLARGSDWVDGSTTTQMTVDNTKFSTASGTYASKTALSTTDQTVTSSFLAGANLDAFWQLQVNLLDSSFSGPLTQTLELTVTC